jgi:shikimate kinase
MEKKIVYLTGFMGAGKSTIGPILANTLGWEFYDLDKEIESIVGEKVKDIFDKKGEQFFRDMEMRILKELSAKDECIISLGGGTLTNEENFSLIKNSGKIIYLKTSPEAAYHRLKFKRDRPTLIKPGEEEPTKQALIEKINALLNNRKYYYEKADIIIKTDNIPVGITVDEIVRFLNGKE